jgi:predicted O-linked N-acetylglucosamine transferase (SPINDLY family)
VFDWLRSLRKPQRAANAPLTSAELAAALQQAGPLSAHDRGLAQTAFEQGNRQRENQHLDAAEQHYRRALAIYPAFAEAYSNLGSLLKDRGQLAEADQWLSLAIQLKPELGPALFNLAMTRMEQARWVDAAGLLQRFLALSPNNADAHYWLGNALTGTGDVVSARTAYQAAVRLNASYVQARWGSVMAQLPAVAQTDAEQAQASQAFARELDKLQAKLQGPQAAHGYLAVGAQQPYFLAYIASNHRAVLANYGALCARLMATWAKKVGVPPPTERRPGKCRLGIVSAHVHSHSVWHALVRGWVEHLDPAAFDIQIFHTGQLRDAQTEWAARRVQALHHGLGHWTQWAKAVSEAKLDVLLYPEIGMDATTIRLSALRLARVQLASWGHPMTTGLPTIDAYIGAAAFEPPQATEHYSENLLLLPRLGCCYQAFGTPPGRVDLAAWGVQRTDRILLCAGTPFKYAPLHDAALVEIARRCQPCKLVFFRGEPQTLSQRLEQRLRAAFLAAGVDFDASVVFIPWQPQAAFFALLDRTDVYLDSMGFSGFNTTMQAVERACPIVAFEGAFMRGRFASAILRQMGLDAWIATSADHYADLVVSLVMDPVARDGVKKTLRVRRASLFGDRETVTVLGQHVLRLCSDSDSADKG